MRHDTQSFTVRQTMTTAFTVTNVADALKFDNGPFPSLITAKDDCKGLTDLCEYVEHNKADIEAELSTSGAVLFRGFSITDAEDFDAFSATFDYPSFTYKESLSNAVRINFTERVFTANEAPKDVEIFLHHEMAQTPLSPDKIFFFCERSADEGGATPVCRSDELFAELSRLNPELADDFASKGVRYTTRMPADDNHDSGQGRSWKSTLSVDTKEQAEQKLADLGYSWDWSADGELIATTPVLPAVKKLADGSSSFYNQLIAAYMGWQGVKDDPSSAITFGDGTNIPKEGLELIVSLADQFTYDLQWQDGDVVLIDNKRVMHGRRPFSGERKRSVLVALA